jgi:DNA-binding NarL/FixJ family response regulator
MISCRPISARDVLMPGLDGLAVLKKIRKMDKKLPVYILTAFSNEERFRVADKLGASGFIVKTIDLKKEIENISAALNISGNFKPKK